MNMRSSAVVTYTVHEPPDTAADRVDRASDLLFVKDGFHWLTALFPPLGLITKQLWLELLGYVLIVGLVTSLLHWAGLNANWIALFVAALSVYLGFEVSSLERNHLDRNGWLTLGSVTGRNLAECERRFFETWLPDQPVITPNKSSGSHGKAGVGWPVAGWGSAPRSR
jgi:Protein of unknown function (DUF2628)